MRSSAETRFAFGYDAHPFQDDRPLYLCGLKLEGHGGLGGHSDADVALHAVIDSLLGSTALGDIGTLFPPDHPSLKGIRSTELLGKTMEHILKHHPEYRVNFLDLTIVCARPTLSPHREKLRYSLASLLDLRIEQVSLKFASGNTLGFTGRGEGIASTAVVSARL